MRRAIGLPLGHANCGVADQRYAPREEMWVMWPMVLRQIIQRVQTWMRRLWRSPRALSPASNPPVTPEQYQPDTRQFPMREEATASANHSLDAHPSDEPAKEFSSEVIPGRPGTEAGDDNLETPDNGGNSSPEALAPSCYGSEETPSSLPEDISGKSNPPYSPPKETEPPEESVPLRIQTPRRRKARRGSQRRKPLAI